MDENEAVQVFDGLMVGDGNLSSALLAGDRIEKCHRVKDSRFCIAQSGERYDHADWMYYIKDALVTLGVDVSYHYPKSGTRISRGKVFKLCSLSSLTSPFLTLQRIKWYPNGVKEIPEGFEFTPASLANAWMGDGSVIELFEGHLSELSVPNFSLHSIEIVERALHSIGITNTSRVHRDVGNSGVIIAVRQSSRDTLAGLVEPYLLPSFRYKIRGMRRAVELLVK